MNDPLPQIPIESTVRKIPLFPPKKSHSALFKCKTSCNLTTAPSSSVLDVEARWSTEANHGYSACKCPHVLIADDDPFQKFYYQALFASSLDFDLLPLNKEDMKIHVCSSGEELISQYKKQKQCKCGGKMLVITDYDMGSKNLNGIETIICLRKEGYNGSIILRTSEKKEVLRKVHGIFFDDMMNSKMIDCFLNKEHNRETKEMIQNYLKVII